MHRFVTEIGPKPCICCGQPVHLTETSQAIGVIEILPDGTRRPHSCPAEAIARVQWIQKVRRGLSHALSRARRDLAGDLAGPPPHDWR